MLPNDVIDLLVHALGLQVDVHEEEVRRVVEREDQPGHHDRCGGAGGANVVDDARVRDLVSLAELHTLERVGVQVGRQLVLLLPDGALERLLAAAVEVRHVLVGRHVVAEMVDHDMVGHIAERRRSRRSVEAAVHGRDVAERGDGGQHPRAARAALGDGGAASGQVDGQVAKGPPLSPLTSAPTPSPSPRACRSNEEAELASRRISCMIHCRQR